MLQVVINFKRVDITNAWAYVLEKAYAQWSHPLPKVVSSPEHRNMPNSGDAYR